MQTVPITNSIVNLNPAHGEVCSILHLAYDGFVMAKLIILLQEGSIKKHKLAKELSDLVNYCVSKRFKDFQVSQHGRNTVID
jgi:hypothetical protein